MKGLQACTHLSVCPLFQSPGHLSGINSQDTKVVCLAFIIFVVATCQAYGQQYLLPGVTSISNPDAPSTKTDPESGNTLLSQEVSIRVLIREAALAQDYAQGIKNTSFSRTGAWRRAVSNSTCSVTSSSNQASASDQYADAMLLYVFNTYQPGSRYPAIDTACIQPQMDAIDGYVSELKSAIEAIPAPQGSSTQSTVGQSSTGMAQDCSAPLQCFCKLQTCRPADLQVCQLSQSLSVVCAP